MYGRHRCHAPNCRCISPCDAYWADREEDLPTCDCCGEEYRNEDTPNCECWTCEECGERNPEDEDYCRHCDSGRCFETLHSSKVHVARKTYREGTYYEIRPGDRYSRIVTGGYYAGGGRWMTVSRRRIAKGPAWDSEAA